jgi:hypothetical protein
VQHFESVPVFLKRYRVGDSEIRIHCRQDNQELVQGWLYREGSLADTILSMDKNKGTRLANWFLTAAE